MYNRLGGVGRQAGRQADVALELHDSFSYEAGWLRGGFNGWVLIKKPLSSLITAIAMEGEWDCSRRRRSSRHTTFILQTIPSVCVWVRAVGVRLLYSIAAWESGLVFLGLLRAMYPRSYREL